MSKTDLRFRQIHLDFHTSELIEGIGSQFDPEEYAATLEKAAVDSVTTFARCHHGYIYFDTKRHPERHHPHLKRNLLKEQIEACHARNIRVPIYVTIQWDRFTADQHPEWRVVMPDGRLLGTPPYEAGFYQTLCVNTPYFDFLKEHVEEIFQELPAVDGFFFDIVSPQDCSCQYCLDGMKKLGLEPYDAAARKQYGIDVLHTFKRKMTAVVRKFSKDATIFYNAGHVGPRLKSVRDAYSHFELESLPSGGWGYMHFPVTMHYARNLGLDCMGMTGKFHTSWGDFHSFKNEAALQYECFNMLALGGKCSIGDQLHPTGKICQTTYNLIGSVYREVKAKEPWCTGAQPVAEIAVFTPEEFAGGAHTNMSPAAMGVTRILQEGAHQFDTIDSTSSLNGYKLLILPDEIQVSSKFAAKLDQFVAKGGALIASYKSGLNETGDAFALDSLGVKLKGDAPYSPDFIVPKGDVGKGLPNTEHVIYQKGLEVQVVAGAKVLAPVAVPYFNRTYKHYCSHAHTPSTGKTAYPGIIRKGNAIYFVHPVFSQYSKRAPYWVKKLVLNAIEMLLPEPLVRLEGPSTLQAALNVQRNEKRYVLHLLHYIPERRGDFDIIEDIIPVYDIKVSVNLPRKVKGIACVPDGAELSFEQNDGRVEFTLPKLAGHQVIVLSF